MRRSIVNPSGSFHQSESMHMTSNRSSVALTRSSMMDFSTHTSNTNVSTSPSRRGCDACRSSPTMKAISALLTLIIRSIIWKGLMIVFSVYLLFGSQIRHLWVPASLDGVFDIIATVVFSFMVLDMLIRILVDPNYFHVGLCAGGAGFGTEGKENSGTCALGSFMFWCDLVSAGTLLWDISYVNEEEYSYEDMHIQLDGNGLPTSGFDTLSSLSLARVEIMLLLTIARSARVARFVRSRTVINMSNKVNWYWAFEKLKWLNPFFCRRRLRPKKQHTPRISLGMGGDESASFVRTHVDDKLNTLGPGVLQMGMSAAVRAREEAESREAAPRWSLKRMMRSVRFKDGENPLSVHDDAATKIQRAWRAHSKSDTATNSSSNSDLNTFDKSGSGLTSGRKGSSFLMNGRGSRFQLKSGTLRESQVGSDMRELTGQRVALGVLLSLVFTVIFSYTEPSTTTATAMISLHNQTQDAQLQQQVLESAKDTSIPDLFKYEAASGGQFYFPLQDTDLNGTELKRRDQLRITVTDASNQQSVGWFSFQDDRAQMAITSIVSTIFIIIIWFVGMTAFSGPVMVLVVTPIERMVRLLGMLMLDPLGYQSTSRFKKFLKEEDTLIQGTKWTKDVLRGMETSFLMSTILRIGSLMKVGFGSAGVEIIRNNLQKGQNKNVLILSSQGSTVSCIFLFCDIRQFTDATECLQEEVFVFTNRIAAVVHSICHSYGGAANKNIGDAFLLSWSLEDESGRISRGQNQYGETELRAKNQQADKALLSVVKICLSLYYDKFYLEPLSDTAKNRLKEKVLKKRTGPVVQMGFGLHAGKAVQGAIGSQRKIDATYVSEAVKRAEFLESETKTYGLNLLMSGTFHSLLTESTRRRCRKIDQVFDPDDDEDGDSDDEGNEIEAELIHLHTFDMDADAIYRAQQKAKSAPTLDGMSDAGSSDPEKGRNKRIERVRSSRQLRQRRRTSSVRMSNNQRISQGAGEDIFSTTEGGSVSSFPSAADKSNLSGAPELVLPTGPAFYSRSIWLSPEMKQMREDYVSGLFFQKYASGLQAFYNKDWEMAEQCFKNVLDEFDDGPTRYFLKQIKDNEGVPPRNFLPYRRA